MRAAMSAARIGGRLGPGGGFVAGQRGRLGIGGLHAARRERPEIAVQRVDAMDAHVGMVVAMAAHRHHLRAELRSTMPCEASHTSRGGTGRKAKRKCLRRAGQRPAAPVGQAAGRDLERVLGLRGEAAG